MSGCLRPIGPNISMNATRGTLGRAMRAAMSSRRRSFFRAQVGRKRPNAGLDIGDYKRTADSHAERVGDWRSVHDSEQKLC
jgi:hypothetical protein